MDWKKLQNGSDIRGVALEGIEGESVNLTNEVTTALAQAFVAWLGEKNGKTAQAIAVGSDSRISSLSLCKPLPMEPPLLVQQCLVLAWHQRQQCSWQQSMSSFMQMVPLW